jgi:hypothetical protein
MGEFCSSVARAAGCHIASFGKLGHCRPRFTSDRLESRSEERLESELPAGARVTSPGPVALAVMDQGPK